VCPALTFEVLQPVLEASWEMSVLLCTWTDLLVGFSFVSVGAPGYPTKTWTWLITLGYLGEPLRYGWVSKIFVECWINGF
jgi:hypothetical protein